MPSSILSALVLDEHPLFRRGIVDTLEASADISVCGDTGCLEEFGPLLTRWSPDVILVSTTFKRNNRYTKIVDTPLRDPPGIIYLSGGGEDMDLSTLTLPRELGMIRRDIRCGDLCDAVRAIMRSHEARQSDGPFFFHVLT